MPKIAYVQCVLMDNGEVISMGKTIGWKKFFGAALIETDSLKESTIEDLVAAINASKAKGVL